MWSQEFLKEESKRVKREEGGNGTTKERLEYYGLEPENIHSLQKLKEARNTLKLPEGNRPGITLILALYNSFQTSDR